MTRRPAAGRAGGSYVGESIAKLVGRRRAAEQQVLRRLSNPPPEVPQVRQRAGVVLGEGRDRPRVDVIVVPERQRSAIVEPHQLVRQHGVELQPVPAQLEVAHDLRPQQPAQRCAGGEPVAGNQLLADASSADDRSTFEHQHRVPGPRQIRRGHQAVVPGADDRDVPATHPAADDTLKAMTLFPLPELERERCPFCDHVAGRITERGMQCAVVRATESDPGVGRPVPSASRTDPRGAKAPRADTIRSHPSRASRIDPRGPQRGACGDQGI